ncbi:MAG: hypothetical protein RBS84_08035 [Kiritimatiellia bacterium]|jgi:ABC-type transport system involved in multi-copper enzyme maturation permease subunit|nr:hypothetical protein [Kiritimatiellia bacterium]
MTPAVPFFAIARLAAIEAIRRPVFLLVSLASLGGILLLPLLLNYTLGDSARIIRDSSLALYLVGGFLLGTHAAAEGFCRDLRRGTAATILAKPVSRGVFFLARATGIALALALFSIAALAATLLAVRAGASDLRLDWAAAGPALIALLLAPALAGAWNHRTRRPFASAAFFLLLLLLLLAVATAAWFPTPLDRLTFPHNFTWNILSVGLLLFLCLGMTTALAAALATRLEPVPVLLLCSGVFMLGLMADSILGPRVDQSLAFATAYALLPNVQAFWLVDALDATVTIPPTYFWTAAAYAGAWSAAALALGAASFHHREIS